MPKPSCIPFLQKVLHVSYLVVEHGTNRISMSHKMERIDLEKDDLSHYFDVYPVNQYTGGE